MIEKTEDILNLLNQEIATARDSAQANNLARVVVFVEQVRIYNRDLRQVLDEYKFKTQRLKGALEFAERRIVDLREGVLKEYRREY